MLIIPAVRARGDVLEMVLFWKDSYYVIISWFKLLKNSMVITVICSVSSINHVSYLELAVTHHPPLHFLFWGWRSVLYLGVGQGTLSHQASFILDPNLTNIFLSCSTRKGKLFPPADPASSPQTQRHGPSRASR